MSMLLTDVRNDVLRQLHIENPGTAPDYVLADVVNAINHALQVMSLASPDYFNREEVTFATSAGVDSYTMADDLREVYGPLVLNTGAVVVPVRYRSALTLYNRAVVGGTEVDGPAGVPQVYYVERAHQSGSDPVQVKVLLAPLPDDAYTVTAVVVKEPPSFTVSDFAVSGTQVPVPHKLHESMLLPLARYFAASSHWFSRQEAMGKIEADYKFALALLGVTDPVQPEVKGGGREHD